MYPVAILMYHEVSGISEGEIQNFYNSQKLFCLPPQDFENHLQYLNDAGFRSIILGEEKVPYQFSREKKHVLLSFDDGFIGNYDYVLPLLEQYHRQAIFFLIAERIGQRPYMSWDQVRQLVAAGMQIGSHGLSHRILAGGTKELLRKEIVGSKAMIEDQIGQQIDSISFPHGAYDSNALNLVQEAGYKYSFTSNYGFSFRRKGGLSIIPRLAIYRGMMGDDIGMMIEPDRTTHCKLTVKCFLGRIIKRIIGFDNYLHLYSKFHNLSE